jgi:hypothetical protein
MLIVANGIFFRMIFVSEMDQATLPGKPEKRMDE